MHDVPPQQPWLDARLPARGCQMHRTVLGVQDAAVLVTDAWLLPLPCQVTFLSGFDEDGEPLKRSMQEVGHTLGVSPQR
jgi:hypothetical protein